MKISFKNVINYSSTFFIFQSEGDKRKQSLRNILPKECLYLEYDNNGNCNLKEKRKYNFRGTNNVAQVQVKGSAEDVPNH
jgi:hypothetical protein